MTNSPFNMQAFFFIGRPDIYKYNTRGKDYCFVLKTQTKLAENRPRNVIPKVMLYIKQY